jgi:hypothetical protein
MSKEPVMKSTRKVIAALAAAAALIAAPASAAPTQMAEELVLEGDNIITVQLNGRTIRLEVRPDAFGFPAVNPAIAKELGMKRGLIDPAVRIGSERLSGTSGVHQLDLGDGPRKARVMWFDRNISQIADGVIGPASLPYARVVFALSPTNESEAVQTFPMTRTGMMGPGSLQTEVAVEGREIAVKFSLAQRENLVTAPTGNWLAAMYGGAFVDAPTTVPIFFGIERPARLLRLRQRLWLGDLAVTLMAVRVRDYGNAESIAEADEDFAEIAETGEILVRGKRPRAGRLRFTVGRDQIAHCSRLAFDKAEKQIRLTCRTL